MDSGGPLLWTNPTTNALVLAGIMTSGIECGSETPDIGTRVGSYMDWIVSVTPGKNSQKTDLHKRLGIM